MKPQFEVVDDVRPTLSAPAMPTQRQRVANKEENSVAAESLANVLKLLTAAAFSQLFSIVGLGINGWMFYTILPNPTVHQIIAVSIFAVFYLVLEFIRRRTQ